MLGPASVPHPPTPNAAGEWGWDGVHRKGGAGSDGVHAAVGAGGLPALPSFPAPSSPPRARPCSLITLQHAPRSRTTRAAVPAVHAAAAVPNPGPGARKTRPPRSCRRRARAPWAPAGGEEGGASSPARALAAGSRRSLLAADQQSRGAGGFIPSKRACKQNLPAAGSGGRRETGSGTAGRLQMPEAQGF